MSLAGRPLVTYLRVVRMREACGAFRGGVNDGTADRPEDEAADCDADPAADAADADL
jgi:hypothetical protein